MLQIVSYSAKTIPLLSILAVFFLCSCKKNNADKNKNVSKTELLSNTWQVSDVKNSDGTSVINLPVPQITCLKDNIFTLRTDHTFTIDEGAVACEPSSSGSGSWSLMSNETKIQLMQSGGSTLIFDLIDVNTSTLKIAYLITDTGIPAADGTYTIILVKS